jgi:hypothetical protein
LNVSSHKRGYPSLPLNGLNGLVSFFDISSADYDAGVLSCKDLAYRSANSRISSGHDGDFPIQFHDLGLIDAIS